MSEYGLKRKTIAKILNQKIESWLKSITDSKVQDLARRNTIVTGGSITSMLMGEKINDFDIYFRNKETTLAVANYYCAKFKELNPNKFAPVVTDKIHHRADSDPNRVCIYVSSGVSQSNDAPESAESQAEEDMYGDDVGSVREEDGRGGEKYRPVFLSTNAITLSDKIQIVIRFYGEPEEIHKNYDYEHCRNVWDHYEGKLHLSPTAMESILSKTLKYTGSLYPICSLFRMRKFLQRGWRISAGEILKMSFQVSQLDLNDPFILAEQLVGMDMLYFHDVITRINEDKESGKITDIDSTYLGELIDEVFNDYIPEREKVEGIE